MMFEGIDETRFLNMTKQEKRWLDNIKKAFYHSDNTIKERIPEDHCLEEIFKAIDTAKTLRKSLRDETISTLNNRAQFIEFLSFEIPAARQNEKQFVLRNARSGNQKNYSLGDIIYDIRCMIHENENLNLADNIDYHILLDWSFPDEVAIKEIEGEQIIINGYFLWTRLREVLSKFITIIDAYISSAEQRGFSVTICPKLGSIQPGKRYSDN